jgi:hypothetical protein
MESRISYLQIPGCRGLLHRRYSYSILAELILLDWLTFVPTAWHGRKGQRGGGGGVEDYIPNVCII